MTTAEVKSRPILFSGPMVRAILDGRKTQTRRIAKDVTEWNIDENPLDRCEFMGGVAYCEVQVDVSDTMTFEFPCPYGKPCDRLWVRETFAVCADSNIFYKADGKPDPWDGVKWKPSIHMPRRASRITLEITDIRVERLNDISAEDAIAEGVATSSNGVYYMDYTHRIANACTPQFSFMTLWESINGEGSWAINPWVWVVEFKRVKP